MPTKLTQYVEAGYSLTPEERLAAARMLRLSVDQDSSHDATEAEAAWRDEVGDRIDAVLAGEVELVDADETHRLISAELASKHR